MVCDTKVKEVNHWLIFNPIGLGFRSMIRIIIASALGSLRKRQGVVSSFEEITKQAGISIRVEYDEGLTELLRLNNSALPSFIFYGDHKYTLEPLLYLLGLPDILKQRISGSEQQTDSVPAVKILMSDMISLICPELKNYIIPITLRDSDVQFLICYPSYVLRKRNCRSDTNKESLYSSAEYLKAPGNSLLVFPQGYVGSSGWKRGIARIMGIVATGENSAAKNTYTVPVSCGNLNMGDIRWLFIRAILAKLGLRKYLPKKEFSMSFGKPTRVVDMMKDMPFVDASLAVRKDYMARVVGGLEKRYYEWVEEI